MFAGALGLLATGADHLQQYTANQFSTVPTIGTLFLMNFIGATVLGVGLLLPMNRIAHRFADSRRLANSSRLAGSSRLAHARRLADPRRLADQIRAVLALAGVGLATTSLIGLWISETSSLFGFTDHGFRPAIVAAIVAESVSIVALSVYLVAAKAGRFAPASPSWTTS
jgi:hypothetical protein